MRSTPDKSPLLYIRTKGKFGTENIMALRELIDDYETKEQCFMPEKTDMTEQRLVELKRLLLELEISAAAGIIVLKKDGKSE